MIQSPFTYIVLMGRRISSKYLDALAREQVWSCAESTCLPPIWPGFNSNLLPYVGWVGCWFLPCCIDVIRNETCQEHQAIMVKSVMGYDNYICTQNVFSDHSPNPERPGDLKESYDSRDFFEDDYVSCACCKLAMRCSSRKYPYLSHGRDFFPRSPTPLEIPIKLDTFL